MSEKLGPVLAELPPSLADGVRRNLAPGSTLEAAFLALAAERDRLAAKVERLTISQETACNFRNTAERQGRELSESLRKARAENAALRQRVAELENERDRLAAEVERCREEERVRLLEFEALRQRVAELDVVAANVLVPLGKQHPLNEPTPEWVMGWLSSECQGLRQRVAEQEAELRHRRGVYCERHAVELLGTECPNCETEALCLRVAEEALVHPDYYRANLTALRALVVRALEDQSPPQSREP